MDQDQYWMLMKRRQFLKSNYQVRKNSIHGDSWEERVFVEDASGHLGGYAWPPRSYSCSFCKREFRSAQALGGHMNVHRRDRARLRHSLTTSHQIHYVCPYQDHNKSDHLKSFDPHFPSGFSSLDHDLDPSCDSRVVASATLSSSRVLSSPQENTSDQTFRSSIIQEKLDTPNSRHEGVKIKASEEDSSCLDNDNFVETELFMGCNSLLGRNQPACFCSDISRKRPKITVPAISFLIEPWSSDTYDLQKDDFETKSNFIQDIDLELRLGEPPKVN